MDQHGVRTAYKYPLMPTPDQAQALATVVWRCRELYNAGRQERKAAWERCGVAVTFTTQSAQLPGIKDVRPEYREINAPVVQDVLHRLDKAFAACFRRVQAGEQPGFPRFQGSDRSTSVPYPPVGAHGGAVLDGGIRSLAKIGRLRVRLQRSLQGTPKTVTISREADGWSACIASRVLRCRQSRCRAPAARPAVMSGSRCSWSGQTASPSTILGTPAPS